MAMGEKMSHVVAQLSHNRAPLVLQQLDSALHAPDQFFAAITISLLAIVINYIRKLILEKIKDYHFEAFLHPNKSSNMSVSLRVG